MSNTPNHGFNTPPKGEPDWHLPLNSNFDQLDVAVELRGPLTERPSTPPDGTKYFETNESSGEPGARWIYDGTDSVWRKQPLNTAEFNEVKYAHTSSDIQSLIDQYSGSGAVIIQLLPRRYDISETIEIKGSVYLRGWLPNEPRKTVSPTTIAASGMSSGSWMLRFRENQENETATDSVVSNIRFYGGRQDGEDVGGIESGFLGHNQITSCQIQSCARTGMLWEGTQSGIAKNVYVERCGGGTSGTFGIEIGGKTVDSNFRRATVIGSMYADTGPLADATPLYLRKGSRVKILPSVGRTGARVQDFNVPAIHISDGHLEWAYNINVTTNLNVGAPGVLVDNGGRCHIRNSLIEKCDPNVFIDNTTESSFVGCDFKGGLDYGNGGHGFQMLDSNGARKTFVANCRSLGNEGDGFVTYSPHFVWYGIESRGNRYGVNEAGSIQIVGLRADENASGAVNGDVKFLGVAGNGSWAYKNHGSGQVTFSGDGSTTTFTINHGLDGVPINVDVTARSADGAGAYFVSNITSSSFDVVYTNAPPSGTDNVVLDWRASTGTSLFD